MTDNNTLGDNSENFITNKLRLSCADAIQLVTDHLDDAMAQGDLRAFEAHLALCESCTIYLDQIKMTIRLTRATGDEVELLPANFDALVDELTQRAGNEAT